MQTRRAASPIIDRVCTYMAMYDIRCTAYTYVYYVYAPACLLLPRRPTATYPILSKFRLTIPKTFTFPPPRALKVIQQLYTFFDPAGAIYYRNTRSGAAARLRKGRAARPRLSIMKVISPPCLRSLLRSTSLPFVRPKDDSFTTEKLYLRSANGVQGLSSRRFFGVIRGSRAFRSA